MLLGGSLKQRKQPLQQNITQEPWVCTDFDWNFNIHIYITLQYICKIYNLVLC